MTLKAYSFLMLVATLTCWFLWGAIIYLIDPHTTSLTGFVLFYSSLFLSVLGTAALIGFVIRFFAMKQEMVYRLVKDAFRQAFLFASLIIASLLLLSRDLFTWTNMLLLVLCLSAFEFFLLSYEKR